MKTKIIISVSGGVVNGVFSNDKDIDVQIVDFDNAENKQAMEDYFNKSIEGLNEITGEPIFAEDFKDDDNSSFNPEDFQNDDGFYEENGL